MRASSKMSKSKHQYQHEKNQAMPTPRPSEKEDEFISRCMGDEKALNDFPDEAQRFAVCSSLWEESKMTALSGFRQAFAEDSYNDYPDSVRNNARRGIELNKELGNKCATQVGKVRGQQIANKEKLSIDTIKRMYSYLSRAEVYYDNAAPEDCGYVSFLLWGGKTGKDWAESKLKGLNLI